MFAFRSNCFHLNSVLKKIFLTEIILPNSIEEFVSGILFEIETRLYFYV